MNYIIAILLFFIALVAAWHLGRCIHEVYLAVKSYQHAKKHPETNKPVELNQPLKLSNDCPPHAWGETKEGLVCKRCGYKVGT